jgi:class 3 adenylate cyclase/predicted ATPase
MNVAETDAPSGLIAMLFADVQGSTRLATRLGARWGDVLGAYHEIVESAVRATGGWVDERAGDGFFVTFADPLAAARAAVTIQRELRSRAWPAEVGELKARMGLHVGLVERTGHGYVGLEIHRAARVGAAAHGGQILMTSAAAELTRDVVPSQALGAHRLKDFPTPTALFCAEVDGRGAGAFPPPRTLEVRQGNLPAAPRRLIGREPDLHRVRTVFETDGERLVSLLGRGGVGKTSLALAAANELVDVYDGGVWWVEAAQERTAAGLAEAIARACRVEAEGPLEVSLAHALVVRGRLLLVLDNLERIPDARELLEALLEQLPQLHVLVTSQLPLGSRLERRLQLESLTQGDALALLARSAQRLDVPLESDPASAELVAMLDGLPLAIELAAGRLRMFDPPELVRRLRGSFAVLEDRARPGRHRSLGAALDWTLGLLDPDAHELFRRLGVFAGPVELRDIEEVTNDGRLDVLTAVGTLLDAALLHRVETGNGLVALGFPESVRQEAARRLDAEEGDAWHRRHARWQRDLVWPLRIYEIVDPRIVERVHATSADTQAALAWAWGNDRQVAREIALGRYSLASRAGAFQEARTLLDRVLADPGEAEQVLDLVLQHKGMRAADTVSERDRAVELLALFPELRDRHARFLCAMNIAVVLTWNRAFSEALIWADRTLAEARELGSFAEVEALLIRADTLIEAGHDDDAEAALRAADAIAGTAGAPDYDVAELVRAHLASVRGLHREAFDHYARALTRAELVDDHTTILVAVVNLLGALDRAGRERELLELAGIADAIAAERSEAGMEITDLHTPPPAVGRALAALGAQGADVFAAGRALEPAARVKRICALLYAESRTDG